MRRLTQILAVIALALASCVAARAQNGYAPAHLFYDPVGGNFHMVSNSVDQTAGSGGSGSVTQFSLSSTSLLSPLFTCSVSNPTTTPQLTCSLSGQSANLVLASPNGTTGAPTFRSLVAADLPTTLTGITLDGVTPTTFGYLDATSSIQTQLNGKQPTLASYSTIVGLFGSGSCSGYLYSDGTCSTPSGSLPSGVKGQQLANDGSGANAYAAQSPTIGIGNGGSGVSLASANYTVLCDSSTVATGIQDRGTWINVTTGGSNDVVLPDLSGTGCSGMYGGIRNETNAAITVARQTSDTFTIHAPGSVDLTSATSFTIPAYSDVKFFADGTTVYDVNRDALPLTQAALTDAATITWALADASPNAAVTLGGNRTLDITNPYPGQTYVLAITQDATGSRTLTLGTGCTWRVVNGGSGAITLTTTAGATDILSFYYDGTNCNANLGKNYN